LRYLCAPSSKYVPDQRWEQASTLTDIYATLNREKIYLKQVLLNNVDDIILDYLCSYSGLEMLDLRSLLLNGLTRKQSDALSYRFFNSVLPNHVNSLRVLRILPYFGGGWCYDPEDASQATVLSQCNKLRSLSVAFNSSFIEPDSATERTDNSSTPSLPHPSRPPSDGPSSNVHRLSNVDFCVAVCFILRSSITNLTEFP
jgi:hypothetical protein